MPPIDRPQNDFSRYSASLACLLGMAAGAGLPEALEVELADAPPAAAAELDQPEGTGPSGAAAAQQAPQLADAALPAIEDIPQIPFETNYHGEVIVDDFQWLEDIRGAGPLRYVEQQNERTLARFGGSNYEELLNMLNERNVDERVQLPVFGASVVVQHRVGPDSPKGRLRVCSKEDFLTHGADAPFETILDIDQLAQTEGVSWVYSGAVYRGDISDRVLISLSEGGTDRVHVREFDLQSRSFVEDGFRLAGKADACYLADSSDVVFAAPTTPENTSSSGYPLEVKIWNRSTTLSEAPVVYRAAADHMMVSVWTQKIGPEEYCTFIYDAVRFFERNVYAVRGPDHEAVKLPLPSDASVECISDGRLYFKPESACVIDGLDYRGGIAELNLKEFLDSGAVQLSGVFAPADNQSIDHVAVSDDCLYLALMEDVKAKLLRLAIGTDREPAEVELPGLGSIGRLEAVAGAGLLVQYEDFVTPQSFYFVGADDQSVGQSFMRKAERFSADGIKVSQEWAVSADGTRVPFFILDGREAEAPSPAILYGYGGFKIALKPRYQWPVGAAWLEQGGVYVVANIRGGGEYGPRWHAAALQDQRHKAYEDFAAVAQRMVALGLTTKEQLGTDGASNGGLLMGNMIAGYPELFEAVTCRVPLLDMLRYDKLLAGSSWVAEYGTSDSPVDYQWLRNYSAYHNVSADRTYPACLFETSTSDDRVHPGHARKMAALMQSLGIPDVYFFEQREVGHGNADYNNWIPETALRYAFFADRLGLRPASGENLEPGFRR